MVKTQIQLPDDLYRRAKAFAAERECSLAEVLRRGAELLLEVYPGEGGGAARAWTPPVSHDVGWQGLDAAALHALILEEQERMPEGDA